MPVTSRLIDHGIDDGNCSSRTTAQPVASFDLRETVPLLTIEMVGARGPNSTDGFVRWSAARIWSNCRGEAFAAEALPPGRYDIFFAHSCWKSKTVPIPDRPGYADNVRTDVIDPQVWIYANTKAMPTSGAQEVVVDNLDKPRFIEVTLAKGRMNVPQATAGFGCERYAFTRRPSRKRSSCPKPTVTVYLKRLEAAGLVKREIDASDLRRHRITLTAAGRKVMTKGSALLADAFAERLSRLSAAQRGQFADILAVLA